MMRNRCGEARTATDRVRHVLLLVVALMSAGCDNAADTNEPKATQPPFSGMTLTLAVPGDYRISESVDPVIREWSAQTGADVRIVDYQHTADSGESLSTTLLDFEADVFVVPLLEVPDLDESGMLQPFAEDRDGAAELEWDGLFPGLDTTVGIRNGRPAVLPVACPVLQCYYRADLLREAGLDPPETWTDYLSLIRRQEEWAGELPILEPWHEDFLPTLFQARAAAFAKSPENYTLLFSISTGAPLLDTPGFQRSVDLGRQILDRLPQEVVQLTPRDCLNRLVSGRAAMVLAVDCGRSAVGIPLGECDAELIPLSGSRPDGLQIASCALPGSRESYDVSGQAWRSQPAGQVHRCGLTAIGGMGLICRKGLGPLKMQAALQLIRRLGVEQPGLAFPDGTRTMTRNGQFQAATGWQSPGLTESEAGTNLRGLVRQFSSSQLVADLPILHRSRFRRSLKAALVSWRDGALSNSELLPRLQREWEGLVKEIGPERVRNSYRRAVGLTDR